MSFPIGSHYCGGQMQMQMQALLQLSCLTLVTHWCIGLAGTGSSRHSFSHGICNALAVKATCQKTSGPRFSVGPVVAAATGITDTTPQNAGSAFFYTPPGVKNIRTVRSKVFRTDPICLEESPPTLSRSTLEIKYPHRSISDNPELAQP